MNGLNTIPQNYKCKAIAFSILMFGLMPSIVQADWWRTPEQQASDALEAGNIEQLQNVAPDANWQAIAKHKNGDFQAAAEEFSELATQSLLEGDIQAANRALYNQGVSDVRAGDFESALDNFEQVLQSEPEFQDAAHNSEIVRQLIEQQQQEQQEQESGEEGDEQSSDSEEQQPSDQQPSDEQSEDGQSEEGQSDEANEGSENSEPSDAEQAASEDQQERDAQAARDALNADQPPPDGQPEPDDGATGEPVERPIETMSESDQAIEQWLRRIPDDPAGLLRRKLEQSHLTEFPEVTDAVNPW